MKFRILAKVFAVCVLFYAYNHPCVIKLHKDRHNMLVLGFKELSTVNLFLMYPLV